MALDVSTLSLRVDSGGTITQATSDLNKFSNAAEKAETRTNSLLASITKLNSVFATNSASAQAFASTMTGIASDTSAKLTSTEAQQWEKLTRQYDAFQSQRLTKQTEEENKQYDAAMKQYQKDIQAAEAAERKKIAAAEKYFEQQNKLVQKQSAEADAAREREIKKQEAFLERQRLLNARFQTSGPQSQYNTVNRAMAFGAEGGDIEKQFGSSVAAKATAAGLAELGKKAEEAKEKVHEFNLTNAATTRELMVLGHELSQGSFKRFGGSMMVLANQANFAQVAIQRFGVAGIGAMLGLVAAVGALYVVLSSGQHEADQFNQAIVLTGNYAGVARGELQQMAETLSHGTGTIGQTKEAVLLLAQSGMFTKDEISKITPAVSEMAMASGRSVESLVEDFAKLAKEPSKAIVELNDKYNFLTGTIYSQIVALEKQGDIQAAASLAEKTYADAMKERAEEILKNQGYIIRGWEAVKKAASKAWDEMLGIGRNDPSAKLAAINAQVKGFEEMMTQQRINNGGRDNSIDVKERFQELLRQQREAQAEFDKADAKAKEQSLADQLNKMDVDARRRDELDREHNRTRDEIRKEEIAKATEDYNSENAAFIARQLKADNKSLAQLKQFVGQTEDVEIKSGEQRIADANAKSQTLLKIAQENGLALVRTEEDLQKRIADIQKKHRDNKGDDPRRQNLENELEKLKGVLGEQQKVYERDTANFIDEEKKKQISSEDFLKGITAVREKYRTEENAFYDKSIAALAAYRGRTATETAEIAKEITKLKNARAEANAEIGNKEAADVRLAKDEELQQDKLILEDIQKKGDAEVESYKKTLAAMQRHLDMLGKNKVEQNELTAAKARELEVELEKQIVELTNDVNSGKLSEAEKQRENQMILELQKKLGVIKEIEDVATRTAAVQADVDLDKFNEKQIEKSVQAAKEFEKVMTDAFGNIGKAIGQASTAFASYQKKMLEVEKQRKVASEGVHDQDKLDKINNQAKLEGLSAQFEMYGQIAGAAKNYFDEGSRGYKAMQAVQAAFQIASIAASIASFAAAAPAAIAKAGAQTGWVGAIAMAGLMAALGFAIGGGFDTNSGDGTSAAERQAKQGTGSVFGDPTAKSNSIANSIEQLSKNSVVGLKYSSEMLAALNSINEAMTGLAGVVVRTLGISTGDAFGVPTGTLSKNTGDPMLGLYGINDSALTKSLPVLGGIIANLQGLWGKTTQEIKDSGIVIQGTLGQLEKGAGYGQYEDVQTTSSSFFGLVKNTNNKTLQKALYGDANDQLSMVFRGIGDAVKAAASELGVNNAAFKAQVDNFNFNIGKVSLRDLSGQQLQDALNNVFSKASDDLAHAVLPGFQEFQKIGEGYLQTVVRVASGTEAATEELGRLGLKAIDISQIFNKQGDVETEIVRQTLAMDAFGNSLSGVINIVNGFQGSASDLIKLYTQLLDVSHQMEAVHLSGNVTAAMISGAGDLETLKSGAQSYQENYFTQAEQVQAQTTELAYEFEKLGKTLPTSKDEFKKLITQIDTSTEKGQKLQGGLLALSGAFSKLIEDAKSAQEAQISGLNDQVSSLQSTQDALKSFGNSIKEFAQSLALGSQSILTPLQKLQSAQDAYETTLSAAKAGDKSAQGRLQSDASAYLDASRTANASSDAYTSAYTKVQSDLSGVLNTISAPISDAQAQIDALNNQITLLGNVSSYTQTVADNTGALIVHTQTAATAAAVSASNQAQTTQAVNNLSAQIAALQQSQAQGTAAQIKAIYDANQQNANTINQGAAQNYTRAVWVNGQVQSVV